MIRQILSHKQSDNQPKQTDLQQMEQFSQGSLRMAKLSELKQSGIVSTAPNLSKETLSIIQSALDGKESIKVSLKGIGDVMIRKYHPQFSKTNSSINMQVTTGYIVEQPRANGGQTLHMYINAADGEIRGEFGHKENKNWGKGGNPLPAISQKIAAMNLTRLKKIARSEDGVDTMISGVLVVKEEINRLGQTEYLLTQSFNEKTLQKRYDRSGRLMGIVKEGLLDPNGYGWLNRSNPLDAVPL